MDSFVISSMLIIMMFVGGGRGDSMSRSCSYVNGREQCTEQRGGGNMAISSSQAGTGPGSSYSQDYAATGDSRTGQSSSSQMSSGNVPQGGFPFFMGGPGAGAFAGGFAGPLPMNPMAFVANQMGQFGFGRR